MNFLSHSDYVPAAYLQLNVKTGVGLHTVQQPTHNPCGAETGRSGGGGLPASLIGFPDRWKTETDYVLTPENAKYENP